jgi:hypothetical protein
MQIKSSSTKQTHTTQLLFALRDFYKHNSQGNSFHCTVNNIISRKLSFRLFLICIQTSFSAHHHESISMWGKCGNGESGKKPHNHRRNVLESNYHSTSRWLEEFFWEITKEIGKTVTGNKQWINAEFISCKLITVAFMIIDFV